jgi:two-component system, LytTR family, response regulator
VSDVWRRVRAAVVDDEPLARRRLLALLADEPDVEVVGEADGGSAAVRLITAARPDLVFLDVQMPGLDGFAVLRAVAPVHAPLVVFVTAYDEHAIRAFEVAAVDYLLKPVAEERFRAAVGRAVARVRDAARRGEGVDAAEVARRLAELAQRLPAPAPETPERIPVRAHGSVTFVRVQDIDWVDATGDQVRLHVGRATHLLRDTMANVEARLPASRFVRIHRSAIVNVDRVREVQPWFKGDYVLILHDGTRLTSGRTYRERVQQLLK